MSDYFRLVCSTTGEILELRGRAFYLGRGPDNDLQVVADDVSRRHLKLEVEHGALFVEDLASANGTFVNGKQCRSRHELRSRDVLGIASRKYAVIAPGRSADLTVIGEFPSLQGDSFVVDELSGDNTVLFGRYPLPPEWSDEGDRDQKELRDLLRHVERRLIRDGLMAGQLAAAFWRRQPLAGEDPLLQVPVSTENRWTIGRAETCDLVLGDAVVSAAHGELSFTSEGWQFTDFGSTNRSKLNGVLVEEPRSLASGDLLSLGGVELLFLSLMPPRSRV